MLTLKRNVKPGALLACTKGHRSSVKSEQKDILERIITV